MRRDKTKELVAKAKLYIGIDGSEKNTRIARSQSVYYIYHYYVRKCLGLEEKKIILEKRKFKVWSFVKDCEYSRGELSASRIASLLIKYRRALKELGAINKKFIPTLEVAKKELMKAGIDTHMIEALNPQLKLKNLEENIAVLKRKYYKDVSSGKNIIVRQAINNIKMYHPCYYRLGGAVSYVKAITNEKQKIRLKKQHDEKMLVNPYFLLNKARAVLNDKKSSWVSLIVALCTVTGRRPTEIMKTAQFKIDNYILANYITFSGLLKSRERKLDNDFGEWAIPVFHDATIIIKSLRKARNALKNKEHKQPTKSNKNNYRTSGYLHYINRKGENVIASIFDPRFTHDVDHNIAINGQYNGVLNNELRKWFQSGDINIKSLRAIYTKMVWAREKDSSTETYDSMTTRVLCYSRSSLSEAVKYYGTIELSNKIEKLQTTKGAQQTYIPSATFLKIMDDANAIIKQRSLRAPALKRIHQWAKEKIAHDGLTIEKLTVTYIRRHCLVGNKKVNAKTSALYLKLIGI